MALDVSNRILGLTMASALPRELHLSRSGAAAIACGTYRKCTWRLLYFRGLPRRWNFWIRPIDRCYSYWWTLYDDGSWGDSRTSVADSNGQTS